MKEYSIFNIQHFSTGDGRGIRTTVFFEGCPLRCPWCHNPECFFAERTVSREALLDEILHDVPFYEQSGGGITVSGGEPLASFDALCEILTLARENGIGTAIDTSLAVRIRDVSTLLSLCDTFLVDVKTTDAEKFRDVCGGDLSCVTDNVQALADGGAEIVFRVPLIPGFNTDDASLDGIIEYVAGFGYPTALLPYHRLAVGKYERYGMDYRWDGVECLTKDELSRISSRFTERGVTLVDP